MKSTKVRIYSSVFAALLVAGATYVELNRASRAKISGGTQVAVASVSAPRVAQVASADIAVAAPLAPVTAPADSTVKLIDQADLGMTIKASLHEVFPELQTPVASWKSVMPDTITVCPIPGHPMTFTAVSKEVGDQRNVWTGKNSIDGSTLTFAAMNGIWDGVIT